MIASLQSWRSPVKSARVWCAQLDSLSPAEINELHAQLDETERARAERFHFERDRNHFVAARGLLRVLLAEILPKPAAPISFVYGAHGKPALAGAHPRIHFNLSHSSGWAMYALAECEVGIDLESYARLDQDERDLARLARKILSARELEFWQAQPEPEERRKLFLRAWTRKEACAKASGRGVFDAFTEIEVLPEAKNCLTSDCLIHDLAAPDGFMAALALRQKSNVVATDAPVFASDRDA